jgi:hypothetical protein
METGGGSQLRCGRFPLSAAALQIRLRLRYSARFPAVRIMK